MTENQGRSEGANGGEVMGKIRVRSRMDDGEGREEGEAGERTAVSLAGVSVALEGTTTTTTTTTKKARQMETITLTGGNNTVPMRALLL